jgi:O-antigen/teichoic acid export membrane protein
MALFPMVAENHADGKSSAHLLLQAVVITALLCTIGAFFYYYFSDLIVVLLYGENYRSAGEILKYFGFAMVPMALILVAENFLIAMGKVIFAYLFVILTPFQLLAIYYFHDSMLDIVIILGISGIILTIFGYGLLWRTFRNGKEIT